MPKRSPRYTSPEMENVTVTAKYTPLINNWFTGFTFNLDFNITPNFYHEQTFPLNDLGNGNSENYESPEGCKFRVANPDDLSPEQKGFLRKLMAEGYQDPEFKQVLENCAAKNGTFVLHFEDKVIFENGIPDGEWSHVGDSYGFSVIDTRQNGVSHININPANNNDFDTFMDTVIHEMLHYSYPSMADEALINNLAGLAYWNIIGNENDFMDYYRATKGIGSDASDVIEGGPGYNDLDGGAGDDTIYGGRTDDYIEGGPGDDIIYGRGGNDIIIPGASGSIDGDIMYGGGGNDAYVIETTAQFRTANDSSGTDDILYFSSDNNATVWHMPNSDDVLLIGAETHSVLKIVNGDTTGRIETVILKSGSILDMDTPNPVYTSFGMLAVEELTAVGVPSNVIDIL